MIRKTTQYILMTLMLLSCSHHDTQIIHEGINDKFTDPNMNVESWVNGFESNDRDVFANREKIVEALNITKNSCVADIGAGTGGFLPLLNKAVGKKGQVFAVEISERFIEYMNQRVKVEKMTSVKVIKGGDNTTHLKEKSCDVLLVDVYHHLDNPTAMLDDFKKTLRPHGLLAIVDFNRIKRKSRPWILKHTRLSKKDIISQVTKEGFSFYKEAAIPFKENMMLIFKKR